MSSRDLRDGVVDSATVIVAIEETAQVPESYFTAAERAYAASKSDPPRRLAVRLAAKRAAAGLLGVEPSEVEVLPARGGPPRLRLSTRGERALRGRGARRTLLSLSHGRTHAVALVLLLQ